MQQSEPIVFQLLFVNFNQTRLDLINKKRQDALEAKIAKTVTDDPDKIVDRMLNPDAALEEEVEGDDEIVDESGDFEAEEVGTWRVSKVIEVDFSAPKSRKAVSPEDQGNFQSSKAYFVLAVLMDGQTLQKCATYMWVGGRCEIAQKAGLLFEMDFIPEIRKVRLFPLNC